MKKVIALTLCGMTLMTAGAQKATVEQAKKLSGKPEKIEEARSLIKEALANPETANDPLTYYTAGKIEWDAYDKNQQKLMANPDAADPIEVADELLNGYSYFLQVFPLEVNDPKQKYSKELQKKIAQKQNNFWDAGGVYYNAGKYYPQAYDAFMAFGDMPDLEVLGKEKPVTVDTIRAIPYFNAGISAWSANELDKAAVAFRKARENHYSNPQAALYEIASWQNIAQQDESREKEAMENMLAAARGGYEQFGLAEHNFLNNIVVCLINMGKEGEAMDFINGVIADNPDEAYLYGMRAYVYDKQNNESASEADYRKAAAMDNVDYETLHRAANKLLVIGQNEWNAIEIGDPEIVAKKNAVRENYFMPAKTIAEKAATLAPNPGDMDYIMESIDYLMQLK